MELTVETRNITLVAAAPIVVEATPAALVGPVSQIGGVPQGALIERGSNANGEYAKWADGTLICWRTGLNLSNVSTASGAIFRSSSSTTWTFPLPFAAVPVVSVDSDSADAWATTANAPTTTNVALRGFSGLSLGVTPLRAMAVGRWYLP